MATLLLNESTQAARDGRAQRLDAVIDRAIAEETIVGAVALIARNGEIVYRRSAGYADREAGRPVSEKTIFRLASMTKTIVSATALALVEENRLSLEDTVEKWLPYFTPRLAGGRRPDITIRQLMTHTSGLSYGFLEPEGNPYRLAQVSDGFEQTSLTLEENLRRLASTPLFYEPGKEWRYSISLDVLGAVVEQAARMRLAEAVARYITGPLGMADTVFGVADEARLAAPYADGETGAARMHPELHTIPFGSGLVFSPRRAFDQERFPSGGSGMTGTAEDCLNFLEALRTGGAPILGEESAAALSTHAIDDLRAPMEGEGWGFSLGAAVLLDPAAAQSPQHAGTWQWAGVLGTRWFVDPVERLTAVVLTNTSLAGVVGAFPLEIRNAIYGGQTGRE